MMMARARLICVLVVATASGAGCAEGESVQRDASSAGTTDASALDAGGGADAVTFGRVYDELLVAKGCTNFLCHGVGMGELFMDSEQAAYANLVGQPAAGPSCGDSGKLRVVAGDPGASLLLEKLSPEPTCGDSMPVGVQFEPDCAMPDNPALCTTADDLALVRDWIRSGAREH